MATKRGMDGKDQCSFGFAQPFGRLSDSAQRCCLSERQRTDANGCTKSTSWGSLVRAQYRPFKGIPATAGLLSSLRRTLGRVVCTKCARRFGNLVSTDNTATSETATFVQMATL